MTTHTPAEWAAALSLGVSGIGLVALAVAFAGAERAGFDPRPVACRALESGHFDPLLIAVGPVLHDTRQTIRRAAAVALLFLLLRLSAPEGATR